MVFQPGDRLRVEVVGGFVEEQDIRAFQQDAAERDPPFLTAGEHAALHVRGRAAQRVHGHLQARVQVPGVDRVELVLHLGLAVDERLHGVIVHGLGELLVDRVEFIEQVHGGLGPLLDDLAHRFVRVERGLLGQVVDGEPLGEDGLALEFGVDAGKDAQQRTLARAVQAEHADLGAVEIGQGDVFEDLLLVVLLADTDHRVDDLVRFTGHGWVLLRGGWGAADRDTARCDGRAVLRRAQQKARFPCEKAGCPMGCRITPDVYLVAMQGLEPRTLRI